MFGEFYKTDTSEIDKRYSIYNLKSKCPNCGTVPNEDNTKKFKCKICNKFVFVKKINYKYYFLTEQEYREVAEMRKFDSLKQKYFDSLVSNGYKQNQLEKDFEEKKITSIEQLRDFIWSSLQNMINTKSNDLKAQSSIYFSMAEFSAAERDENDVYDFQKLAFNCQLKSFDNGSLQGINYDVIVISNHKNPECFKDNQRKRSYKEMINNPILPHIVKDSKFGCSCTYGLVAKRDENGRLIFNDE